MMIANVSMFNAVVGSSFGSMLGCIGDGCLNGEGVQPGFWGGEQTTSFKLLFAIHIISIVAAFGPPLLYATLFRQAAKFPGDQGKSIGALIQHLHKFVSLPALAVTIIAGVLLILDSADAFKFSDGWVSASFSIVLLLLIVVAFGVGPALRRFTESVSNAEVDAAQLRSARMRATMFTMFYHLALVALVLVMVWKPGSTS